MGQFFISYSRKDFYFAESLFYALQSKGIDAWMDVWKITPGDNWDNAITEAINSAQAFILIATKESLQSPNVRDEIWRAFLAQKPIYLVIRGDFSKQDFLITHEYLGVNITIDSYDCVRVVVDMRRGFKKGLEKITNAITRNAIYQDKLPGIFNFKMENMLCISSAIIFLTLLMVGSEVWKYGTGVVFEDLVNQSMGYIRDIIHGRIGEVLLLVPMTIAHYFSIFLEVTLIIFSFNFIRRKHVQASDFFNVMLRDALGLGIIVLIQDGGGMYENIAFLYSVGFSFGKDTPTLSVDMGVFILFLLHFVMFLLILILGIVFIVSYLKGGQGAILRWLPTGRASQKIRYKGNEEWIRNLPDNRVSPPPSYKSYFIVASPEDRAIAKEIRAMFQRKGYRVTDHRKEAECDLIILSPFADDSPLKKDYRGNNSKPAIYVLARSMNPQKDASIALQWIDYRRPTGGQFWKQWERRFLQLKSAHPVFPYVPETILNSLLPTKYGWGIVLTMIVVAGGSAWLISGMEYLILLSSVMNSFLLLTSIVLLLSAMSIGYYTTAQMLRGAISQKGARRWLTLVGILSIIAAFMSQSRLFIIDSLGIVFVSMLTLKIAWPNLRTWLPPKSTKTNKKSLLQPISKYKAFTSSQYRIIMIAGFIVLNALIVDSWIVPPFSQQSPAKPYTVTVPGPYNLAAPGLWSQDTLANAFGFHFTYQSNKLEISQNQAATAGYTSLEFLGTNAYPMHFAPHFRSSIHIQFTKNDPRTGFGIVFDDASAQQFTLLAPGFWVVNGSNTRTYSGRIAQNGKAPAYTLEVEVNGILCIYRINGKEIIAVTNPSISYISNILFMFVNIDPSGAKFYLSHFTYTPLSGPVLSRNEAIKFVTTRNAKAYTTVALGWHCNPNDGRWNSLFEPAQQNTVMTCTNRGTLLNRAGVMLAFDNSSFGGLSDMFDYSFNTTFASINIQCIKMFSSGTATVDTVYLYYFTICSNGNWAINYEGSHQGNPKPFLNKQLRSGHITIKRTISLSVEVRSITQRLYINKQLITSYGTSGLKPIILFGNDNGPVLYSNFSYIPRTLQ